MAEGVFAFSAEDSAVMKLGVHNLAHISFSGAEAVVASGRGAWPVIKQDVASVSRRGVEEDEPTPPFIGWMLQRAGLPEDAYRSSAMRRRVSACLRRLRVPTTWEAQRLLERRPELLSATLNAALIGVSQFFRDEAVFRYLEFRALPALLGARERVRVCSAGCSDGQELYSVAMLAAEAGALPRFELTGIDCRTDAVREAARGCYSRDEIAVLSESRQTRFFREAAEGYEIAPRLRGRTRWHVQDLLTLSTPARWDLVLFRNVSIYLTEAYARSVWTRLCDQLEPGGLLVTGKAERPPPSLPLRRVEHSIYRKESA